LAVMLRVFNYLKCRNYRSHE